MNKDKVLDINTGQPRKSKAKTAQDAKRYRQLMIWLETGLATLTVAGQILSKAEVGAISETLDEQIESQVKEQRRLDERKRRSKRVKD